jgi:two-component system invasion response regulator UvrY
MTKASAPNELIAAIRKISEGGKYISASLAEKLTYYLDGDASRPPQETLSDREYQVMLMIASGKTVTQVADELCLSVKTISTYRTHILEKMKLKNNAEITLYAVQNKLVGWAVATLSGLVSLASSDKWGWQEWLLSDGKYSGRLIAYD